MDKQYKVRYSAVLRAKALDPVNEPISLPSVEGWAGRSDAVQLAKGERLKIVEYGDAERWSLAIIIK